MIDELALQIKEKGYILNVSQIERECGLKPHTIHNCMKGKSCKAFISNKELIKGFLKSKNLVI